MAGERSLLVRFGAELSDFEKATAKAAKSIEQFGNKLSKMGDSLTKAVSLPLGGLGAAAIAASQTMDGAFNIIRNGTGATGDQLTQLQTTFKEVFAQVPASADAAATAIAEISTRTGATGEALKALSVQILNLAKVTGEEVGPLAEGVTKALNNWGVTAKDQGPMIDYLLKVSQSTGLGIGALTEKLAQGGASFRAMGIPIQQAAAMLGQFDKAGVSSEVMFSGLNKAAGVFAGSGRTMQDGWNSAIQQIKNAGSDTVAAKIAVDLFGESGVRMADAIRKGNLNVQEFSEKLAKLPGTVNQAAEDSKTLADRFSELGNKLVEALTPLGKVLVENLTKAMPQFIALVGQINDLVAAFVALPQGVQSTIVAVGFFAVVLGPILSTVGGVIGTLGGLWSAILMLKGGFLAFVSAVFSPVSMLGTALDFVFGGIGKAVMFVVDVIGDLIVGVEAGELAVGGLLGPIAILIAAIALIAFKWDWIKEKTKAAWEWIKSSVQACLDQAFDAAYSLGTKVMEIAGRIASEVWEKLKTGFEWCRQQAEGIWTTVVEAVSAGGDRVRDVLKAIAHVAFGIAQSIIDQVNRAIQAISGLQGSAASKIGASVVGGAAGAINSPGGAASGGIGIPAMASGGIVTSPTLALIGEAGPEAVVPLSRMGSFGGGGGGPIVVNVVVSGSIISQKDMAEQIRKELVRTGQRNFTTGLV